MRSSDWSSDVCSSDLLRIVARVLRSGKAATHVEADLYDGGQIACRTLGIFGLPRESVLAIAPPPPTVPATVEQARELRYVDGVTPAFTPHQLGRASHRERVCQYA